MAFRELPHYEKTTTRYERIPTDRYIVLVGSLSQGIHYFGPYGDEILAGDTLERLHAAYPDIAVAEIVELNRIVERVETHSVAFNPALGEEPGD